jgi:hypothetical protein
LKSALSDRSKYVRDAAAAAISNLESQSDQNPGSAEHAAGGTSAGSGRQTGSAAAALEELLSSTASIDAATAEERASRVARLASFGVKAVDALQEYLVDHGINEDQFRHIAWAVGRIDEAGAGGRILRFGFRARIEFQQRPNVEMAVQALRAIARPGVATVADFSTLNELASQLPDDLLFALLLTDDIIEPDSDKAPLLVEFLFDSFGTAMRWEKRIHLEREYGILGAELDPLYGRVERVLRSMKGPYYFRPSEVRAERLAERGIDAEGLVLTEEQVSRVRLGDVVTTVLEHEYEHGYHVSHVKVRVDEEPRETSDGRLFRGTVESVEPWAGPYVLREGERVWFLGAHVHGEQD